MIGFFLYLCTIYNVNHYLYLLPFVLLFVFNIKKINFNFLQLNINYLIILAIIVLSFVNILISKPSTYFQYIPYTILMIPGYFIAQYLKKQDLRIIVYFIIFETAIAVIEYMLGISSVFYKSDIFTKYTSGGLFYYTRTYGLSANSSIYALKILLAILVIDYFNLFEKKKRIIVFSILFIGLLLSFSRTVIITITFYFVLKYLSIFIKKFKNFNHKFSIKKYYNFVAFFLFAVVLLIMVDFYKKTFVDQITRGKEKIELSGREIIWPQFYKKIKSNLIFGNHSIKFYADYHGKKNAIHAHNSFLQVFGNNGVIIFILFLILLIININRYNLIYILTLILYSMTQYGIFWGISLTDIILFMFFIYNTDQKRLALK